MDKIVFYHKSCLDGFSCCWISYLVFKNKADYIALEPKAEFDFKNFKNKEIYFFDLCPSIDVLLELRKENKIIIIDHHITNKRKLKLAHESVYNNKYCASYLTWFYFFKNKKLPVLLDYINHIDLWKKNKKFFKEVLTFLEFQDQTFSNWSKLKNIFEEKSSFKKIVEQGKIILAFQEKLVDILAKRAYLTEFEGFKVYAVNSPFFGSLLGEKLISKNYPFSIIWYQNNDEIKVSLRSIKNFDVSKIALKYNGGGHKNASGFTLKINEKLPWKKI